MIIDDLTLSYSLSSSSDDSDYTQNTDYNNNNNSIRRSNKNEFNGFNEILFRSVKEGLIDGIKYAIQFGANINGTNCHYDDCNKTYGYTPLMIACYYGHEHIVHMLLNFYYNSMVNCNIQSTKNGCTALMVASQQGHKHIVQLLLNYSKRNTNKNKQRCLTTDSNTTTTTTSTSGTDVLIQNNDTTNTTNNDDDLVNVNLQDKMGNTALIYATYYGHNKIVKILLQRKDININIHDAFGRTALRYAIKLKYYYIIKTLMGPTTNCIDIIKEIQKEKNKKRNTLNDNEPITLHHIFCSVFLIRSQ